MNTHNRGPTRVFCFITEEVMDIGVRWVALSQDGDILTGGISSTENWARRDSTSMRYPDGFQCEWISNPRDYACVQAALWRHLVKSSHAWPKVEITIAPDDTSPHWKPIKATSDSAERGYINLQNYGEPKE